ncbi:hypothetical protein L3Q82_026903 [Scortum barcoo]|uniref:Uncharacterized protein n=1 Tax=Scortum barcoo TaxID=214431 RepID=A0ACB8WK30_9TELE|nr:hypothetical protein L3Q82_026903 [Scortum barcoo]
MTQQWWACIRDDNDLAYREEVEQLVRWCEGNNLILTVDKTKEIIVDRKIQPSHTPLLINNMAVVSSTKFLGCTSQTTSPGDLKEYRKSRYALRRAISSAKRQYRDKVESHYKGSNTRSMWARLKTLTDYKKKISSAEVMSASLPDKLNTFYARFESTYPAVEVQKAQEDHCPPRADVCRTLKRINTRKAPGPDGIPGRALKVCAGRISWQMSLQTFSTCHCSNGLQRGDLTSWCQDNNLHLNVSKTKGLIVDFRKRNTPPSPSTGLWWRESAASGSSGFTSVKDLTWTHHTDFITKSARQQLIFLHAGCGGSTLTQGYSVASTDESRFTLSTCDRRDRVWRRRGERSAACNILQHDRFGSGSVVVWGGWHFFGEMAAQPSIAKGSLTAIRYRDEILRPLVRPYAGAVGPGFLLMQDNARPHVAGVCQQFLQDEGIDAMDWPARSPDLNPIEHIWDIMSRSIHQHHVAPQTVQEDALVQVWEEIPQETIHHLIRSMPRHCREVIPS